MDEKIARTIALRYVNDVLEANTKNWILDNGGRELSGTDFTHIMSEVRAIVTDLRRERLAMLEDMLDAGYTLTPPAPVTTVYSRQEDAIKSSGVKGFYGSPVYLDEAVEVANDALVATIERTIENWTPSPADMPTIIETSEPAQEEIKPSTLRWRLVREYNAGATAERRAEIEAILREKAGLRIVYDVARTRFEATPVDKPLGAGRVEKADAPAAPESVQEETEEVNGVEITTTNRYQLIDAFNEASTNLVARNAIVKALKKLGFKPVKKSENSNKYVLAEIDRDTPAPPSVLNNLRPDFIERRAYTG